MIHIEVGNGEDALRHVVSERALIRLSPRLAQILGEEVMTEEDGRVVFSLPDDDPEAWRILIYALLSRSLPHMYYVGNAADTDRPEHDTLLVRCWLLGEKYEGRQFQDLIMAEIIERSGIWPIHPRAIAYTAEHAKPTSMLYKFMLEEEAVRLSQTSALPAEEDSGLEATPKALRDAAEAIDLESRAYAMARLQDREVCLEHMVDGGPDEQWFHAPVPFCHCRIDLTEEADDQ